MRLTFMLIWSVYWNQREKLYHICVRCHRLTAANGVRNNFSGKIQNKNVFHRYFSRRFEYQSIWKSFSLTYFWAKMRFQIPRKIGNGSKNAEFASDISPRIFMFFSNNFLAPGSCASIGYSFCALCPYLLPDLKTYIFSRGLGRNNQLIR
jgi:hypothetical protein